MLTRVSRVLMLTVLGGIAPVVVAQGVGGDTPIDTTLLLHRIPQAEGGIFDPPLWAAELGFDTPVSVTLDPQGSPWNLHLATAASSIAPGDHVFLIQSLVVGGSPSWTGWHEEVNTSGFSWIRGSTHTVGQTPKFKLGDYLGPSPSDLSSEVMPNSISFSFGSLPPGTGIYTVTEMVYTGTDPFQGSVDVVQYPIPEPGTITVAIALATMLASRRGARARTPA
jgi:hypothetical protein